MKPEQQMDFDELYQKYLHARTKNATEKNDRFSAMLILREMRHIENDSFLKNLLKELQVAYIQKNLLDRLKAKHVS